MIGGQANTAEPASPVALADGTVENNGKQRQDQAYPSLSGQQKKSKDGAGRDLDRRLLWHGWLRSAREPPPLPGSL